MTCALGQLNFISCGYIYIFFMTNTHTHVQTLTYTYIDHRQVVYPREHCKRTSSIAFFTETKNTKKIERNFRIAITCNERIYSNTYIPVCCVCGWQNFHFCFQREPVNVTECVTFSFLFCLTLKPRAF